MPKDILATPMFRALSKGRKIRKAKRLTKASMSKWKPSASTEKAMTEAKKGASSPRKRIAKKFKNYSKTRQRIVPKSMP